MLIADYTSVNSEPMAWFGLPDQIKKKKKSGFQLQSEAQLMQGCCQKQNIDGRIHKSAIIPAISPPPLLHLNIWHFSFFPATLKVRTRHKLLSF